MKYVLVFLLGQIVAYGFAMHHDSTRPAEKPFTVVYNTQTNLVCDTDQQVQALQAKLEQMPKIKKWIR